MNTFRFTFPFLERLTLRSSQLCRQVLTDGQGLEPVSSQRGHSGWQDISLSHSLPIDLSTHQFIFHSSHFAWFLNFCIACQLQFVITLLLLPFSVCSSQFSFFSRKLTLWVTVSVLKPSRNIKFTTLYFIIIIITSYTSPTSTASKRTSLSSIVPSLAEMEEDKPATQEQKDFLSKVKKRTAYIRNQDIVSQVL